MMQNHWNIPKVYDAFREEWKKNPFPMMDSYLKKESSFLQNLLPELAVQLSTFETISLLEQRFGRTFDLAIHPNHTNPKINADHLPDELKSPVRAASDSAWIKTANVVGINVRTIGSFWNVVKYALTLSEAQSAIHLLPIWEPGVVGSLYGMASWNINPEFFSDEFHHTCPHLDTVEKQLKAVINVLHVMGKTVGMDVIPHADRFSEIVLANPHHFEWLQREDTVITSHASNLHLEVQGRIMEFLEEQGTAQPYDTFPKTRAEFFSDNFSEADRLRILFGNPKDFVLRNNRRNRLMRFIIAYGYEPVPATMGPPYRGLVVDVKNASTDADGRIWRDYKIEQPQAFSRVFGPLTRYKLYERLDDNACWEIDFDQPRTSTWEYVCRKYTQIQKIYGFDFMRGDMSHVQMRQEGVAPYPDEFYDLLGRVKTHIQAEGTPNFAYFAETFLAPPNVMAYGIEADHLEAAQADATLGDLQSMVVGSEEFLKNFRNYLDLLQTRRFAPSFTIITGDKDDPRFDHFYTVGNETRFFIALFLSNMPSYMSLGFRSRDLHFQPAPNEHYTKLYVFQIREGDKATHTPYQWGKNAFLFHQITRIQQYADKIWQRIKDRPVQWLLYPDPMAGSKVIAWLQPDAKLIFVVNLDTEKNAPRFAVPIPQTLDYQELTLDFSTETHLSQSDITVSSNGWSFPILTMGKASCRVYQVQ